LAGQLRGAGLEALEVGDAATDVRAVFGWSYRALGEEAARVFRLLGLHPGPDISARAAASLAGIAPDRVAVLLSELTRAHLLTEPSPDRYAFHDLLRVYAADLAHAVDPEVERDAAEHRLVDHYLCTAFAGTMAINPHRERIELDPPADGVVAEIPVTSDEAFAWFAAEHAVLVGAVAHLQRRGRCRGAWRLAWTLFSYLSRAGHWRDLVDIARLGLEAAALAGDRGAEALGHRLLGSALTKVERYDESEAELKRSLRLYEELGDATGEAQALQDLGWLMEFLGRHREGVGYELRAMELARAAGHEAIYANALNALGWAYASLEEYDKVIEYGRQALPLMEKLGEVEGQAATWDTIGLGHYRLGQHDEAVRCYRTAINLFRDVGNRYLEATTLGRLMDALATAGDLDAARHTGERAVAILDQLGHSHADGVRERLQRL
jgi:tetratricopeptide (TPR) repeat protein